MAADPRRITALVDRQGQARATLTGNLVAFLLRLWRSLEQDQRYSEAETRRVAAQMAAAVGQARRATASATDAYLRAVFAEYDREIRGLTVTVPDDARGIPGVEEYLRPVKEYRRARLMGLDDLAALDRAATRLEVMADMDLSLAARDASAQVMQWTGTAWRRVVRPELSAGGSCGLCVAVSTRLFKSAELQPLHERCKCLVLPVVVSGGETFDPGLDLNAADLGQLYRDAGSTSREDLKRTRYRIESHGELGPVLRAGGDNFRGPREVAADLRDAPVS